MSVSGMKPSVTVIMPAHNAAKWIGAAIASVLRQTYTEFDLWVLENGSTDGTAAVARGFTDPRVKVFELGPVGFQGALQYAIEKAESPWLARMDADDLMLPDRLQVQMTFLQAHPQAVFVGTAFAILTPFGHIFEHLPRIETREVDREFLGVGRGRFGDPCTVFSRQAAREAGGVDAEFTMGDVPLLFRLLTRGPGWQLSQPLYIYRVSPRSMSKHRSFLEECFRARRKYAPEALTTFPAEIRAASFWDKIALLELIAGDGKAVQAAIAEIERETNFQREALHMKRIACGGRLASAVYAWRYRHQFRRRADWERDLAGLESPPAAARPEGSAGDILHIVEPRGAS